MTGSSPQFDRQAFKARLNNKIQVEKIDGAVLFHIEQQSGSATTP